MFCLMKRGDYIWFNSSLLKVTRSRISSIFIFLHIISMYRALTPDSSDSGVFYAERSSEEQTPPKFITLNVLNSTELSGVHVTEVIRFPPVTSPEPDIMPIESDTIETIIPHGNEKQEPIIPHSLKHLNLPPKILKYLVIMAVVQPATSQCDEKDSQLPPVPSVTAIFNLDATHNFGTTAKLGDMFRRRDISLDEPR